MDFRLTLGHVIRYERRIRGLRLRDLSKKASVALGYLSEVERGKKEASSLIIDSIAAGLNMPTWQLLEKVVDSMKLAAK